MGADHGTAIGETTEGRPQPPLYTEILVPLDGSELAEAVLPHATALARAFGARLTLVRAYTPPATVLVAEAASVLPTAGPMVDPGMYVDAERGEAEAYLEAVGERLRAEGLEVDWHQPRGSPGEEIVRVAEEAQVDLIAMTTHSRTGLGRLLLSSVADHVLHHAPCPVLLVRLHAETTV